MASGTGTTFGSTTSGTLTTRLPFWQLSHFSPFSGLIVCDGCGLHLTAAWSKKTFAYYVCHTKSCECYGKSIRRKDVEEQFSEVLKSNTLKSEVAVLVEVVFERVWKQEVQNIKDSEVRNIHKRKELEARAVQLTDAIFSSKSLQVKSVYETQLDDVAMKIEALDTISVTNTDLSVPYRTALDKAVTLLKSPYDIWITLDIYEQHRLFYFIFEEKLSYNQKTGYRTEKSSSAVRLFEDFAGVNSFDVVIIPKSSDSFPAES